MAKQYDSPWVLRSLLFVPGHLDYFLDKCVDSGTDCLVLDLEDAVPDESKLVARNIIKDRLVAGFFGKLPVMARINPLSTGLMADDIEIVANKNLAGFIYPMSETVDEINEFDTILKNVESRLDLPPNYFSVILLIETPAGILNANNLAGLTGRTIGLMFGSEDFLAETCGHHSEDESALHTARSTIVMAARAAGIEPIDAPFVNVHDLEGLNRYATQGRKLGMGGMVVLSPRQMDIVHRIYTPSSAEIEWAEKVVKKSGKTAETDMGVMLEKGVFISPPTLKKANRILERMTAITQFEKFISS